MPTESVRKYLAPFWRATHVTADPVVFIRDAGQDTAAHLLFPPETISAVTNAAGDVAYHEGVDYLVEAREGRIVRPAASRMPLTPPGTLGLSEPSQVHERLVTITYTHAPGLWSGYVPAEQSALLPRTVKRLRSDDAITICVMGDSISEGYDASGFRGVPPHQPPYASLLARGLELARGRGVDLVNLAVGGWTTEHAEWQTPEVASHHPDLVVIAFGMNDACYAEPSEFASRVADLMAAVRNDCAGVEFLLVSPMLPTPECDWVPIGRIQAYSESLAVMANPGVAVADVTSVWGALLNRKHPHDLSGNGTNHPNDFGHRVYAQTLLATLGIHA